VHPELTDFTESARTAASTATATTGPPDIEAAVAAAANDTARLSELLDALASARLWLPLPDDGEPVTDGSAVNLPTVTYLGREFVPAYTSADLLLGSAGEPTAVLPHAVVQAADLARLLPAGIGIALNAGARQSVPVYPEGVAYLASARTRDATGHITVGPVPQQPDALLAGIRYGLRSVGAAETASAAWLTVESAGEGLVISVQLDDPAEAAARDACVRVVEQAALAAPEDTTFPIDVTFPGEGEPDDIDGWIAGFAVPFYRRDRQTLSL
jgi:SseB protein N-terminal domain